MSGPSLRSLMNIHIIRQTPAIAPRASVRLGVLVCEAPRTAKTPTEAKASAGVALGPREALLVAWVKPAGASLTTPRDPKREDSSTALAGSRLP